MTTSATLAQSPRDNADPSALLVARLNRLPATRSMWRLVALLSLGGFFEFYELFSTAYVMPGIVKAGLLTPTTASFIGLSGVASYIAATFVGLFIGTFAFGFVADRLGRRTVFTWSLLWYCACAIAMACQSGANGLNFWRLMTGIGLGIELVTIDAYLSELVPASMRGRAFALNQVITYTAVPSVALAAFLLVPRAPLGVDGWRWVIALGALGSIVVWFLRRGLPESPRWLAATGQHGRAEAVVRKMERRIEIETGKPLAAARRTIAAKTQPRGRFSELWRPPYASRTVMLLIFHLGQSVGLYGFSNWLPTFLMRQGASVDHSLGFGLALACITPLGPLLAMTFADRVERKWQLVASCVVVAAAGLMFASASQTASRLLCGGLVAIGATIISLNFHAYQSELFPTRIRALAVGFVYSASRVSGTFSGFLIAYVLGLHGVAAALALISGCMAVIAIAIAVLGPRTRGLSLEEIND